MPDTRRVLDTSALMSGRTFAGELFTTEEALRELRRQKALSPELHAFLELKVRVLSPSEEGRKAVLARSEGTGDAHRLSPADVGLLALAADLGATIVSDDYSIQNMAVEMGIPHEAVLEKGITKHVRWRYRCTGCHRFYGEWRDVCTICGAKVRTTRATK